MYAILNKWDRKKQSWRKRKEYRYTRKMQARKKGEQY